MAISCYVGDDITLDVDDPGYGNVFVSFRSAGEPLWTKILRGRSMWRALENITELALTDEELDPGSTYDVDGLWPMTVALAKRMLPQFQHAVLYAAAGSDRAERLTDDDEANYVLCARCHEGSDYSGHVMVSEDCQQYGHQPFGYAGNWDQAQEYAAREREWAEIRKRNAEPVTVPTDTPGQPE